MSIGLQIFACQKTTEFATDHLWRKADVRKLSTSVKPSIAEESSPKLRTSHSTKSRGAEPTMRHFLGTTG
jgi:hypothetical protein